jgi:hypothetical protein
MYTIDRINRLRGVYGLQSHNKDYIHKTGSLNGNNTFRTWNPQPGHKSLDELDVIAGIETGGTLGERVLRHEEQLTWRRFIVA